MYIVDVIPLSRGMQKETLSYFTSKKVSRGAIVSVPLRLKNVGAIVVDIRDAKTVKTDIKNAHYGLKKVTDIRAARFFLPAFIEAAEHTASYFVSGTGAIIETLTPSSVISELKEETFLHQDNVEETGRKEKTVAQKYTFQAPNKERFAAYKGIIREEFAKGNSVFFCTPTVDDIGHTISFLGRGIEGRTHILHSGISKRKFLDTWSTAILDKHPVLIIGTGSILSMPRHDINTMIIDAEHNWAYKRERRPFVDVRIFAEYFADALGVRLIMGGTVLRVETLYRNEISEFTHFAPPISRPLSSAKQMLVDMLKTHTPLQLTSKTFTVISEKLKVTIEDAQKDNQNVFLLVSRRGLFPITLCSDCGSVILCRNCDVPVGLHKQAQRKNSQTEEGERIFLCHKCGEKNVVKDRCKNCDSWRLTSLGVGAAHVEEKTKELFPNARVLRVDKDSASTKKKAAALLKEFLDTPGSILIGTEMALNLLHKKIAITTVVSIDPLFSLPSFRTNERVFNLLMRLREQSVKKFIIQSRIPETPLFQHVLNGNITDFYKEEIEVRKTFGYPPFSTLIKLTYAGTKQQTEEEMSRIKKHLDGYDLQIFPAFTSKVRGKYITHAMIKIARDKEKLGRGPASLRGKWPDKKLISLLRALPPSIAINVDPEHLL
jgi:primosomal protein N' (replication factor Y)